MTKNIRVPGGVRAWSEPFGVERRCARGRASFT